MSCARMAKTEKTMKNDKEMSMEITDMPISAYVVFPLKIPIIRYVETMKNVKHAKNSVLIPNGSCASIFTNSQKPMADT